MRHQNQGRRLSMDTSERTAMFRNMVTSLLLQGTIKTTEPRAKELRRFAERVITISKRAPVLDGLEGAALDAAKARRVHAIRRARRWVNNDEAIAKLFGEYKSLYATRPGGYTRIIKAGKRGGDNAAMAIIAMVGAAGDGPQKAEKSAAAAETPAPESDFTEAKTEVGAPDRDVKPE